MSPHVFVVAGEESGDRLAAPLIAAIKRRAPDARFSGVGGAHMAGEGVPSLFPLGDLAIVGFTEIVTSLPKLLRRIRQTADAVVAAHPDVLVIIDSPEFTHRVARRVRAIAPEIPIVDYVCPSVWAWRPWRARAMRSYVDHVLALLPFEPAAMRRLNGPPCTYVGHPLGERVADIRPSADEARRRLADPPVLLVLPGSRGGEIDRLASTFGMAAAVLGKQTGSLDVVVPTVPRLADKVRAAVKTWGVAARVVTDPAEKNATFRIARAALTKSGTATLELALAGVPMVTGYKVPLPEAIVGRLMIGGPSIVLANLVLGENAVPELVQGDCAPAKLAMTLLPLMSETPERARQLEAFARLDSIMEIGRAVPSDRAASVILECVAAFNQPKLETVASPPPTA